MILRLILILAALGPTYLFASCSGLKGKDLTECKHAEQKMLSEAQADFAKENGKEKNELSTEAVFKGLEERGIKAFWVCGTSRIQPTRKSMKKEFLIGAPPSGYVLTDILPNADYQEILEQKNIEEAKQDLTKWSESMRLWSYSKEKGLEEKGKPSLVEIPLTATVKDCLGGAKTTLGRDCSSAPDKSQCCREKPASLKIQWKQATLLYPLSSTVYLKVSGETSPRFCNLFQSLKLGRR